MHGSIGFEMRLLLLSVLWIARANWQESAQPVAVYRGDTVAVTTVALASFAATGHPAAITVTNPDRQKAVAHTSASATAS
jgi:hypothetical protein